MRWFLTSNSSTARLLRTVLQGLLGVLVVYMADILGFMNVPSEVAGIIAAATAAILSPIMAKLGEAVDVAYSKKMAKLAGKPISEEKAKG